MLSGQHINYMLELENTTQNSSEQITTLDYQTDIKDSRKEDLLLQICTHQKLSAMKRQEWDEKASAQLSKNCIG